MELKEEDDIHDGLQVSSHMLHYLFSRSIHELEIRISLFLIVVGSVCMILYIWCIGWVVVADGWFI